MAKLDAEDREALPKSDFGQPGDRKYPMPDASHAANAKARATQQVKKGAMSAAEANKIKAKANKILERGGLKKKAPPADTDKDGDMAADTDTDGM